MTVSDTTRSVTLALVASFPDASAVVAAVVVMSVVAMAMAELAPPVTAARVGCSCTSLVSMPRCATACTEGCATGTITRGSIAGSCVTSATGVMDAAGVVIVKVVAAKVVVVAAMAAKVVVVAAMAAALGATTGHGCVAVEDRVGRNGAPGTAKGMGLIGFIGIIGLMGWLNTVASVGVRVGVGVAKLADGPSEPPRLGLWCMFRRSCGCGSATLWLGRESSTLARSGAWRGSHTASGSIVCVYSCGVCLCLTEGVCLWLS